jgi:hypothetical protein
MILIYLDPMCFELYFRTVVGRIASRLSEIVKKEQKILSGFLGSWSEGGGEGGESPYMEMEKEEKYWSWRQSKKAMREHEESLGFVRSALVDIGINLLPKFKKIRFNYHCGKNYREWKLEIEILK